jgi:O-antigen/teichoic acid export membrane protein
MAGGTRSSTTRLLHAAAPTAFLREVGAFSMVRVGGGALLFTAQVLLAGWMGADAFGTYSFAWAWVAILATLAGLGFGATSVRFIARYRVAGAPAQIRGLLHFTRSATLISGSVVMLAGLAGATLFAAGSPYLDPLRLAFLAIPIIALLNLEAACARGFGWMASANVAEQIARPLLLMVLAWTLVALTRPTAAEPFVLACVIAYMGAALGQHLVMRVRVRRLVGDGPKAFEARAWLRMSLPLLLQNGAQMLLMNADLLVVGVLLGPLEVGVYTAAVRIATLVSFLYVVTSAVAQPTIASLHAQGRHDALQGFVRTTTRWMFCASLVVGLVLGLFGELVLGLFGPDFIAGEAALRVLIAGHVAVAAFGPVTSLLVMTGHQDSAAAAFAASALSQIALSALLVPLFGVIGAAVAVVVNLVLTHAALFALVRRHLGLALPGPASR